MEHNNTTVGEILAEIDAEIRGRIQAYPRLGLELVAEGLKSERNDSRCWWVNTCARDARSGAAFRFGGVPTDKVEELLDRVRSPEFERFLAWATEAQEEAPLRSEAEPDPSRPKAFLEQTPWL